MRLRAIRRAPYAKVLASIAACTLVVAGSGTGLCAGYAGPVVFMSARVRAHQSFNLTSATPAADRSGRSIGVTKVAQDLPPSSPILPGSRPDASGRAPPDAETFPYSPPVIDIIPGSRPDLNGVVNNILPGTRPDLNSIVNGIGRQFRF